MIIQLAIKTKPSIKAAVLYGKEDVRIEGLLAPALKNGQVRIRIRAALTCGTDLKVFKRGYHAKMIVPPAVFGHELAGEICEVGPGTAKWQLGDRVVVANSAPCGECFFCTKKQENLCDHLLFLNGAYAESIVVQKRLVEKNLLKLHSKTSFKDAALTEPLACVVQGMEDIQPCPGDHLLVIGAGPIGLMFAKLAAHLGCEVTVAGRGEVRLETAKRLGANQVVDAGAGKDFEEQIKKSAKRPFDAVIEAVGQPHVWEAAIRLVRKGGTVNFFGGCPAATNVSLDTSLLHYSNLKLLASFHHTPRSIRKALKYIEEGVIHSDDFVNGECLLDDLPALFRSMARGNRAVKTLVRI
jgi:L-iditol 2-dehydrogenase